ncbi:MAG: 16S rRNA (cytidine(1402)-2'-O)-methyltransferase [Oscillospiraceae bacterium]|jgi:16S rRNA (cytidine1402-2'-O)-methyltransferase|nr:16S rRNA (cytidine(1402)-2'-O)-methyltransferase [Oscillospiraceae bacterium]MCI1990494.1 16S rRNA (cytidine(1402)-2'-O)-methyltransferase [Oscillospiraceae bacterium]MCI2034650.1 16S rRNA (cytidine(1402)-2'-O)-methyltransferase [Oscillospiraceae bacterium]
MSGKLVVVGTPIGNLSDFSPRGVQALSDADFIAAEDTRVTRKLLNRFGVRKPLICYFEHNKYARGEEICARMEAGETCALVSDAGMPAISDPGETLVAQCAERNIPVFVVPGPSAVVSALAVSGLPTGRFTFEGFLSVSKKGRREHLAGLKDEHRTMVFYEAPHKLAGTLADLLSALGDRRVSIVRELTKIHEEVIRTTLSEAAERYADGSARGEFVLVVEGAPHAAAEPAVEQDAVALGREYLAQGFSASEAAKRAASETGRKKHEIYKELTQDAVGKERGCREKGN